MHILYLKTALIVITFHLPQQVKNEHVDMDIDLHAADLSLDYHNSKMLAYSRISNNYIIQNKESDKYGQLEWVSFGVPHLVFHKKDHLDKEAKAENCSLFKMNRRGFTILVEMLT
jgi:diaminopimelate epimerase